MKPVTKRKVAETAKGYAFIGINLIGVIIFWILPLLFSLVLSVSKWDFSKGIAGIKIVGFQNYVDMWRDEWFRVSLVNNIVFTVGFVVILLTVSFIIAVLLKNLVYGSKLVQLGLYLPYIVNVVAIAAVWLALLSRLGPVSGILQTLGVENPPILIADLTWAMPTVIIINVWQGIGYTAILFLAGLVNVPEELYESAEIDGANAINKTFHITIPMLSPTTFFILITTIINSFKVFGLINIMTGGGPGNATTMLVYNIYRTAFQFGKMEFASAQGIVLLIMIFIVTVVQFRYQKKFDNGI